MPPKRKIPVNMSGNSDEGIIEVLYSSPGGYGHAKIFLQSSALLTVFPENGSASVRLSSENHCWQRSLWTYAPNIEINPATDDGSIVIISGDSVAQVRICGERYGQRLSAEARRELQNTGLNYCTHLHGDFRGK